MKKWKNEEELQNWASESKSIADFCRKLEIQPKGSNYEIAKKLIEKYNLTTTFSNRKKYRPETVGKVKKLSEILESGNYKNATKLKERLIRWGVKKEQCECCGNTKWLGEKIKLEIHHIDGNHNNNHLENLQLLCPNCHAFTNNYRGKNILELKGNYTPEKVQQTITKLKELEVQREHDILENKIIYCGKTVRTKKELRYCEICGKPINRKALRFCSPECSAKASSKNEYNKEILLEQSKTVSSLAEFGRLYNITDNALKKHLEKFGILEECKKNFIKITKTIIQYDLNGNFIKEWVCGSDAAKALNISKSNIMSCCVGSRKSTHGYSFKYKNPQ